MYTEDYYSILGIEPNASPEQIKNAYRIMCKAHHPDIGGDETMMKLLNKAYITLSDDKLRAAYDRNYKTTSPNNYRTNPNKDNTTFHKQYITAKVLDYNGNVFTKDFDIRSFSMNINQYKDDNGLVYIYNDNRTDKNGKYTVLPKYLWECKLAYYKNYTLMITCYLYSEKNGISTKETPIYNLSFDSTDHITKGNCLYVIEYSDGSKKHFHSFDDWYSEKEHLLSKKKPNNYKIILGIVIILSIVCLLYYSNSVIPSGVNYDSPSPTPSVIAQEPPEHGTRRYNIPRSSLDSYIEFETSKMSSEYCYIIAIDADTGEQIQSAFIHTKNGYKMYLPAGTYELFYSCGDTWYGYKKLFGPEAGYTYCDSTFTLTLENYYEVTLYSVANGNMNTEHMSYDEFLSMIN